MPDTRTLSAAFAAARLAFGAGLIAAPERVARGWLGADAGRGPVKIAIRGLGARDVALSAALVALRDDDGALATLLAVTVLCDLSDVAATLAAPADSLPDNARWGTVALAGVSAAAGAALALAVKR